MKGKKTMASTQTDAGKGKKGEGRKNALMGFVVGKLDADTMKAFAAENGIEINADGTPEQIAMTLAVHFKDTVLAENQVLCDNCRGVSSADLDACPFCGDEGEVDDEEAPGVAAAAPSESLIETAPEEEDDEEMEEPGDPTPGEDETDEDEEEAEVEAAADESDGEAEEVKATPTATTKKGKGKMATTEVTNGAGKKGAAKGGLAKVSGGLSTRDLDKAIAEVSRLKTEGVVAYWDLGRKVLEINEKGLWKLRTDDAGKAKYKSFDAFVHHELGMSPAHAYNAIECARGYESAEAIREIGSTSKAVLLLKAPEPARKEIAAKIKAGATKKEVESAVKESRKKHGSPKKDKAHAKAGAKSGEAKTKAAARDAKVSVTSFEGTKTIALYKKPATMKGLDLSELARAKSIGDQPFGRYEMANGLVQYFFVGKKESGELVLKIQTVREES